jgi:ectoine hydroxylase-related dioxygenase (phytanoyl-CoA dioxygenase family)
MLEFYERGYLRPGRVFDDDQVAVLRDLIAEIAVREQDEGRLYDLLDPSLWPDVDEPVASVTTEKPRHVDFMFNLWRVEPRIREFVFDPSLARLATQLIGTSAVRLLEDNALWKEPRSGGELKWHQDFPYWPLAQPNAVTAWIALDDTDEENGAMSVAIGSHLTGERLPAAFGTGTSYLRHMRPPVVKPIEDPEAIGLEVETVRLRAGEVSFHSSLTWHGSGPNDSDRQRRAIIIRYVGDGTVWLGSRRYEYNYTDEEVGLAAGEPIGGEYFPLIPT